MNKERQKKKVYNNKMFCLYNIKASLLKYLCFSARISIMRPEIGVTSYFCGLLFCN